MREALDYFWWKYGDNILAHIPMMIFVAILVAAYVADHV